MSNPPRPTNTSGDWTTTDSKPIVYTTSLIRNPDMNADISICSKGVYRNQFQLHKTTSASGEVSSDCTLPFHPAYYNLLDELNGKMVEIERKKFLAGNWVQVEIEFTGPNKDEDTLAPVMEQLSRLRGYFFQETRLLKVKLDLSRLSIASSNTSDALGVQTFLKLHINRTLEKLVNRLNSFKNLKDMHIVLEVSSLTDESKLLVQLLTILPSYHLYFIYWDIKLCTKGTMPVDISQKHLSFLNMTNQQRLITSLTEGKVQEEKGLKKQEKLASVSLEYTTVYKKGKKPCRG